MIFNRGKPRHALPRRPWAAMLVALLTTIALVFVPGTALADSGMDVSKWQGCVGSSQAATAKNCRCQLCLRQGDRGQWLH